MNRRKKRLGWLFAGGLTSLLVIVSSPAADIQAAPFASPTPVSIINQPYVTFQNSKVAQKLLHVGDGVPIYLTLLLLILLLGLVALYLSSIRPRR